AGPQPQQEFSGAYFSCSDCSMLTLSMLGLWRPRIFPELRPHVKRSRPDETIVVVLLSYVRTPSGNARRGKERCVQFRLKPEHEEHRRCVKIDIRAQTFLAVHHFLELFANRDPVLLAGAL